MSLAHYFPPNRRHVKLTCQKCSKKCQEALQWNSTNIYIACEEPVVLQTDGEGFLSQLDIYSCAV